MGLFTVNFYIFLTIPLAGMILTLLGAISSMMIQSYVLSDPEDDMPWHVTVGFSAAVSGFAICSYPYMDRITRKTRFNQLAHEKSRSMRRKGQAHVQQQQQQQQQEHQM